MITIATFDNTEQADLVKGRLELAGIHAFVADATVVTLNWMYSNAVGGVKVQVDDDDLHQATALLHEWNSCSEGYDSMSDYRCPGCDSTKVEFRKVSKRFFILSLLVLGIPLAFYLPRFHCLNCGKTWKLKPGTTIHEQADPIAAGR